MYGVLDPTRVGQLSLEYLLDGGTLLRRVDFTGTGSSPPNSTAPQTNFAFFTVPAALAAPGPHTLLVDVIECTGNQTFVFDYATYTAPLLDGGPGGPVLPPASAPVHVGKSRVGPIVGGVVGGVVLLLLVGLLLDCVRRRRRQVRTRFGEFYVFFGGGMRAGADIRCVDYPFNHKLHRATLIPLESVMPPKGDVKDPLDLERK